MNTPTPNDPHNRRQAFAELQKLKGEILSWVLAALKLYNARSSTNQADFFRFLKCTVEGGISSSIEFAATVQEVRGKKATKRGEAHAKREKDLGETK